VVRGVHSVGFGQGNHSSECKSLYIRCKDLGTHPTLPGFFGAVHDPQIMQNRLMPNTYLTVTFKDKDAAKALGARWDAAQRQWYVPDGRDLAPFAVWLPAGTALALDSPGTSSQLLVQKTFGADLVLAAKKGVSLSSLLAGVSQAVAQAYRLGVWTLVEVVELRTNGGHVFMGVSERDAHGSVLAKTSAVIWQSTANMILPEFEQATGAQLAPGIKLLVRARPVFKPQHGFSLEIDAIDSEYTLGDLEARKREIRERLQLEGVFANNRQLPAPWDYNDVLVIAPEGGAGLGDFQAEADRLEMFGVCRFTYVFSRFQGEGAAREIGDALQSALVTWPTTHASAPDAVVIIRGGGAVNDLAWLNDYDLARLICDSGIPVLTGIGHERDNTVLDEVAHTRLDTPSKVIAGIEHLIVKRTTEAQANMEQIVYRSTTTVQSIKALTAVMDATVRTEASRHLAQGRQSTSELIHAIRIDALQGVRSASEHSREALQSVKSEVVAQLADARREVPLYWGQIVQGAAHLTRSSAVATESAMSTVLDESRHKVLQGNGLAQETLNGIATSAGRHLQDGAIRSEALMREVTGQGPDKTLRRGFALVRNQTGQPITRAKQAHKGSPIEIEFHDGKLMATPSTQH
jgi:exodeoxyribonuclease VII large subunit